MEIFSRTVRNFNRLSEKEINNLNEEELNIYVDKAMEMYRNSFITDDEEYDDYSLDDLVEEEIDTIEDNETDFSNLEIYIPRKILNGETNSDYSDNYVEPEEYEVRYTLWKVVGHRFKCIICGKEFDLKVRGVGSTDFCSKKCMWVSARAKAYENWCNKQHYCKCCGKEISIEQHSKYKGCCDDECRKKHNRDLAAIRRNKKNGNYCEDIVNCAYCGKPFNRKNGRQKYCSNECKIDSQNKRQLEAYKEKNPHDEFRFCKRCGKKFVAYGGQIYCSAECRTEDSKERHDEKKNKNKELKCKVCGKKFVRSGGRQKYCSVECREFATRENRKKTYKNNKD